MSSTYVIETKAGRTTLGASKEVWAAIKVEACRALLAAWTEKSVPVKMRKGPAQEELMKSGLSIDFDRVFGWRDEGAVDPEDVPGDGATAQEWAVDRAFFLNMQRGVISETVLLGFKPLGLGRFVPKPAASALSHDLSELSEDSGTPSNSPKPGMGGPAQAVSGAPSGSRATSSSAAPGGAPPPDPAPPILKGATEATSRPIKSAVSAPLGTGAAPSTILQASASSAVGGGSRPGGQDAQPSSSGSSQLPASASIPSSGATKPSVTVEHGVVQPPSGSLQSGLAAVLPRKTLENDPYWPYLTFALKQYGFITKEGKPVELDAHSIPRVDSGRVHATGRIALFGVDRRSPVEGMQRTSFSCVLENVELSFVPGTATVMAASKSMMDTLAREPRLQEGNSLITVPLGLQHSIAKYTLGTIKTVGDVQHTASVQVPMFTLAPDSPTVLYQSIHFGTSFQILHILPPAPAEPQRVHAQKSAAAKSKSRGKTPAAKRKFTKEEVQDALVEWLRTCEGSMYASNAVVLRIQQSSEEHTNPNHNYKEVRAQIDVVVDLCSLGRASADVPEAGRGRKVSNIVIAAFLGRSAGWVGNCVTVSGQLQTYGDDRRVRKFLKTLQTRGIGVRTLLEGLTEIENDINTGDSPKGKKRQRVEEALVGIDEQAQEGPLEDDYDGDGYDSSI